jgi:hypothetical protein
VVPNVLGIWRSGSKHVGNVAQWFNWECDAVVLNICWESDAVFPDICWECDVVVPNIGYVGNVALRF